MRAPIDRCFLLSTSIPLLEQVLGMRPVAGRTSGLIAMNEWVLWRGWKFGLPVRHETLITGYDRPGFFQDTMVRGQFTHFHHDHRFEAVAGHTLLVDAVKFSLPYGAAGQMIGRNVVVPHILDLLRRRYALLKQIAESDEWKRYLPDTDSTSGLEQE